MKMEKLKIRAELDIECIKDEIQELSRKTDEIEKIYDYNFLLGRITELHLLGLTTSTEDCKLMNKLYEAYYGKI